MEVISAIKDEFSTQYRPVYDNNISAPKIKIKNMERICSAENTCRPIGATGGVPVESDITERCRKQSIQHPIAPTDDDNQMSQYIRAESSYTRCSRYHDGHLNCGIKGSTKVEDKNDDRKWTRDVIFEAELILIKSEIDNLEVTDDEMCTQPFDSVGDERGRNMDLRNEEANSNKSSIRHTGRKISRSTSRSMKPFNFGRFGRIKDKRLPISVKQQQREGAHALLRAAKTDSIYQIQTLANHGISTEIVDQRGWTPLTIALENENMKCAEVLIQLNANVNFVHVASGMTILHHITAAGIYKGVKFLLRHGANVNAEDSNGWPPLHYAIKHRHLKCSALLLAAGCHSQTYTEKRVNEYEQVVRLATIGKWKYHWQEKLDIDLTNEILL